MPAPTPPPPWVEDLTDAAMATMYASSQGMHGIHPEHRRDTGPTWCPQCRHAYHGATCARQTPGATTYTPCMCPGAGA